MTYFCAEENINLVLETIYKLYYKITFKGLILLLPEHVDERVAQMGERFMSFNCMPSHFENPLS